MRICLYISNNFKQLVLSGQTELGAHILICFTSEKVFSIFLIRKLLAEDSIWEILRNLWEILRNTKHLSVITDWCFWVILYVWEQFLNHYTRPGPLDYNFMRNFWEILRNFSEIASRAVCCIFAFCQYRKRLPHPVNSIFGIEITSHPSISSRITLPFWEISEKLWETHNKLCRARQTVNLHFANTGSGFPAL